MKYSPFQRFNGFWRNLAVDSSGLALTEFAFAAPILLTMLAGGTELSNYAVVQTSISQVALQLADNGTRIGTKGTNSEVYVVSESQINDILDGANQHAGSLDIYGTHEENGETIGNGKVVISNVVDMPTVTVDGQKQYKILWQRCRGESDYEPAFGTFGQPSGQNIVGGIGPAGQKAFPPGDSDQLIFVEVQYRYQPIFLNGYAIKDYSDIRYTAALLVRDSRLEVEPSNNAAGYFECDGDA
jgi:Flp pilus assembly protein TadG